MKTKGWRQGWRHFLGVASPTLCRVIRGLQASWETGDRSPRGNSFFIKRKKPLGLQSPVSQLGSKPVVARHKVGDTNQKSVSNLSPTLKYPI